MSVVPEIGVCTYLIGRYQCIFTSKNHTMVADKQDTRPRSHCTEMFINLCWILERIKSESWLLEWPRSPNQIIGLMVSGATCLHMCVFVPGAYKDDNIRDIYEKYFFTAKIHSYHREEWK